MPNIKLNYRYCDYANYKNNGEVIFTNSDNLSLQYIEATLRAHLMDDLWFHSSQWGLKDLHFETYDDEIDHAFHEFVGVEVTEQVATEMEDMGKFLETIKGNYSTLE